VLQNKFLRCLLFTPKRTPTIEIYQHFSILPLNKLYKYSVAIFIYKFINLPSTLPPTVRSIFQTSSSIHNYSTRNTSYKGLHHSLSMSHRNQIAISGPQIWDAIPLNIKQQPTLNIYKKHLHQFLVSSSN